ncbi:toll/interleukin-1 receptor domain-containing protein [Pseudomonas sp. PDM19]|uniref:toll/interleukin-1 receptor domain-containing protein n=1 Tax=Pseudomonas sp. PDM19 TaxID=2769272 RepID=UPI00177E296A|nr:toll/interleukin-1 receptor domain-containing protein [Pseudomonas sp. PDM19]MBD9633623.1 toll/interleukin-1 receptor domain-containing protein [Pseudomonas sp. PDM19]
MSVRVFLSHNHHDKPFVRKLAADLEAHNVTCWLDEAEMKIGDSLIQKIREGIDNSDYFAVVVSPHSVIAPWVQNELDVAMSFQIGGKKIKVLPLVVAECELPGLLPGKLYGDFKDENQYEASFKKLLASMEIVYNANILNPKKTKDSLATATDKASAYSLRVMSRPFHRPFQYMGLTIERAEIATGASVNEFGNIVVENEDCKMTLQTEGNFVSFIEVDFVRTAPHSENQEFDSEALLGALSISLSELELIRKKINFHTYYDHKRKIKLTASCLYDGAPLSIAFSSKYYNM